MPDRTLLIELAERLIAGEYNSDLELDADMALFARLVQHPRPQDLIYHWPEEFDHEPSAEEVVERALSYSPLEL